MPRLKLYTSNRLEHLLEPLARVVRKGLDGPLTPEVIVVHSPGTARWISMRLGERLGIWANCRFPLPRAFLEAVFRVVLAPGDAHLARLLASSAPSMTDPLFEPQILTWRVMKLLAENAARRGFESLDTYLRDDVRGVKRFQLATRIADTFDQYTVFRSDMVLDWEAGKEDHWQADLWRRLTSDRASHHRAALREKVLKRLRDSSFDGSGLPERLSVFGIPSLPPFYVDLLAALARHLDVHFFLLSPSAEGWTRSRKPPPIASVGRGTPLLASLGGFGADFVATLRVLDCAHKKFYEDPGEGCLLASLQSDILCQRNRGDEQDAPAVVPRSDLSVQVHSCHSPAREIEVLHDNLLALLDEHEDLTPRQIVVMAPDIETYAPYIDAVFGSSEGEERRIPYSIADRSTLTSPLTDTFFSMLRLAQSRMGAAEVVTLLEVPAVARRFDLQPSDLELVRRWVEESNIRWGVDGAHRERHDLPALEANTWRAGLDRLLLGYALPGGDETMFAGTLPFDDVEGSEARVLGKLLEFTERLFSHTSALTRPRPLTEWSSTLSSLLEQLFLPDEESEDEAQWIRDAIADLAGSLSDSGFSEPVSLEVIRDHLRGALAKKSFRSPFLRGGVTFCTLLPMRSIPFEIVCLIGMDDGKFPRPSHALAFDLMRRKPRRGDRSPRLEDRYLFLEALLSARRSLYLSYVGQSLQDNSRFPPSVVVSELLDTILEGFRLEDETEPEALREHLVVQHRLQAFHPAYFSGEERRFSYSHENLRACRSLAVTREPPKPFIQSGLPEAPAPYRSVDLERLCRFFANPSKFLLRERLQMELQDSAVELDEREPMALGGLEKYLLDQRLVERGLAGQEVEGLYDLHRAAGTLPHGAIGRSLFAARAGDVRNFLDDFRELTREGFLEPLRVSLKLEDFELTGRIDGLCPDALILQRYTTMKAKDRLRAWLHHLALNLTGGEGVPSTTILLCEDQKHTFSPVTRGEGRRILGELLGLYWSGLSRPLRFFPRTSLAYADAIARGRTATARSRAEVVWRGTRFNRGERKDPFFNLCFGDESPIDGDFRSLTETICRPLLQHETESKRRS